MTVEQLIDTATTITESETFHTTGLKLITFGLPEKLHRKLNEELHYRITKSDEELIYSPIIEVTLFDINFKIVVENA